MLLRSYLNLISVIACSRTVHPWFGLLHTIHYFIVFCKIVKTGTAYVESSFLVGLRLRDLKKLRLQVRPWARIQTPETLDFDSAHLDSSPGSRDRKF